MASTLTGYLVGPLGPLPTKLWLSLTMKLALYFAAAVSGFQ